MASTGRIKVKTLIQHKERFLRIKAVQNLNEVLSKVHHHKRYFLSRKPNGIVMVMCVDFHSDTPGFDP